MDASARTFLGDLADGFGRCAEALRDHDRRKAEAALLRLSAAHGSVTALETGIAAARSTARWSLRGRLAARHVEGLITRYDRRAIRLFSSALLFGESLADAMGKEAGFRAGRAGDPHRGHRDTLPDRRLGGRDAG